MNIFALDLATTTGWACNNGPGRSPSRLEADAQQLLENAMAELQVN